MNYFFILGNHPELSLVEIVNVLRSMNIVFEIKSYSREVLIISSSESIPLPTVCTRLGGTIKAGVLIEEISNTPQSLETYCIDLLSQFLQKKVVFGISAYTVSQTPSPNKISGLNQKSIQRIGLSIKKELRASDRVVRFVMPQQGSILSSVVVSKQHLIQEGNAEIIVLIGEKKYTIGRTQWIQPFESYSQRDWDRPEKSMKVGMLPPKLAQIMINVAGIFPSPNITLLDPFCGLGTILQESWLMGFRTLIGSDLEIENINRTEKNIQWIEKQHNNSQNQTSLQLFQSDVRNLSHHIDNGSIDCIVTEPFLGPIVNNKTSPSRIKNIQQELSGLYIDSFKVFNQILKKGGIVSTVWPVWRSGNQTFDLPIINEIKKLGFKNETIPNNFNSFIKTNSRGSLLYSRPDQTVMREIFVWRKQ